MLQEPDFLLFSIFKVFILIGIEALVTGSVIDISGEAAFDKELLEDSVEAEAFIHVHLALFFKFFVLGDLDLLVYGLDLSLLLA